MEKIVNKGDYFYYQRGKVSTTKPWNRPDYNTLKSYLEYIDNNSDVFQSFEAHLTGGVLFDFEKTWDVDIVLSGGNNISNNKLESYINYMTNISLNKFNLLTDIFWSSLIVKDLYLLDLEKNNFHQDKKVIKKVNYIKKVINDDKFEYECTSLSNIKGFSVKMLTKNLCQLNLSGEKKYPNKVIDYLKNRKHTKFTFPIDLFLKTDEEYFIRNTNR